MTALLDSVELQRRFAWPAVLACFCSAVLAWGFGFYGQSVFLATLRTEHGWSTALIATATTSYYLVGAVLIALTPGLIDRLGPRVVILGGAVVLTAGALLLSLAAAPWQLFAADLVMAAGWATTSSTAITNTLALWFDRRRGLAISLALNGASAAGFTVAPALVHLTGRVGLTTAVALIALALFAVLLPAVLLGLRDAPRRPGAFRRAAAHFGRHEILSSPRFRSVAAFYALALIAQVGFIVHLVALLQPQLGTAGAANAVAAASLAAMLGRLATGAVIDRLNQRRAAAISVTSQAAGVLAMLLWPDVPAVLYGGAILFGLSVGNVITFPALIVQREFPAHAFGAVIGLANAIAQFAFAFAPALLGIVHDLAGGYAPALALCIALQLAAAVVVLRGGRSSTTGG
ncbi:MAG TPA: MFS transporter [Candidatus Sulfotelmatobacter sp.]|nr:MFS transporter [Candidatus Sulfotelmatobacter sp.]